MQNFLARKSIAFFLNGKAIARILCVCVRFYPTNGGFIQTKAYLCEIENGKLKIEKVASKREQRVLAHYAEREQLKATKVG